MSEPRVCVKCGIKKPFSNFASDPDCEGGRRKTCRRCQKGKPPLTPPLPTNPEPEGFSVRNVSSGVDENGVVEKQWIGARRDSEHFEDIQDSIPEGHRLKGVSTLVDERGNVRAQWIKTDLQKEAEKTAILDAIRSIADTWPEREAVLPPEHVDEDLLCIYPMGDPHFGMYSWAAETGDDYDLELAEQYHVTAMDALVNSAPSAEHALIIELGDFFHMDTSKNVTPGHGHQLDVDTRRPKVARAGVRAMRRLIDRALLKHGRVEVWCIPGNHDPDSVTMLQLALELYYENDLRVHVNPSPAIAMYRRFGNTLIGATHTHTIRDRATLAEMMAGQRKEDWGQTEHRYWYCGHVHHDSLIETRSGVIIETLRTLAGKDKYAADNFYNAGRDMKCDVVHRQHGRIVRNIIGIPQIRQMLENKPRG